MSVWMDGFLTWDTLDDRSRIWECHDSSNNTYTKTNANIGISSIKVFSGVTFVCSFHECAFLRASIKLHWNDGEVVEPITSSAS